MHVRESAADCLVSGERLGDRIARLCNYWLTPDVLAEVCAELGVPFRSNGYLFPLGGC